MLLKDQSLNTESARARLVESADSPTRLRFMSAYQLLLDELGYDSWSRNGPRQNCREREVELATSGQWFCVKKVAATFHETVRSQTSAKGALDP